MQNHAADQLDVEMAHVQRAPASLAGDREGFDEEFVEDFFQGGVAVGFDLLDAVGIGLRLVGDPCEAVFHALAEVVGLGAQLGVGKLLHRRLERIDGLDLRQQALDLALVFGPEDLGY